MRNSQIELRRGCPQEYPRIFDHLNGWLDPATSLICGYIFFSHPSHAHTGLFGHACGRMSEDSPTINCVIYIFVQYFHHIPLFSLSGKDGDFIY